MAKQKLILVGNGMAGVKCIEEILKLAPDAFDITIFGSEPHPNYNRIMLSKVLQGDTTVEDITINSREWYKENGIKLFTGETVAKVVTHRRQVITENGLTADYDHLILATGSVPFMLPLPGANKTGVTAFRDMNDCRNMIEASKTYRKAIVIGGGLLGLEAARGLLNLGMEVEVVHIFRYLMERQLDPVASDMLKKELERQGMRFLLEKQSDEIVGKDRVEGLRFKDGTVAAADLIVMAVGVRPNVQLAKDSDILTNRGIVVNDRMETNIPHVYAVGECAEHRGIVYGLVAPLYEQGKVLAQKICGAATEGYHGSVLSTQLKVSGVDVFSAGEIVDSEDTETIQMYDGVRGKYKKIWVKDGKIVGAVLFGDSSEGAKLLGYIKQQADVSVLDAPRAAAGGAMDDYVCGLSDKETVCSCNGVSKGAIVSAIRENGLDTFEQVRQCTKASSSCGGCRPLVSAILDYTLANEEQPAADKETVCGCTDLSREELKEAVQGRGYVSVAEAMRRLRWKSPEGCGVCRAALLYYVGAAPGEAALTPSSGVLADGTQAIIPRTYGGAVSARQLRRIADVADKYGIPHIRLAENGHLKLLGVESGDVRSVLAELDMPAAVADYGLPVASVAACVGERYDPHAMQDSVRLAAALERALERLQLPGAVSVAVSASPQHKAGTLVKDLGIAGAPGGWEIYVGGSGQAKPKKGELLCTAASDEDVLSISAAFLQWYREDAYYGETTADWIERVGLLRLREGLFDTGFRAGLTGRLYAWNDPTEGEEQIELQPKAAGTR
ncbi:nitrite reductase large subunit NirB [Paenibacillus hamazuiensis]|uniref:nitrite reductase large subunit NirB n=1 Tax=Paenibacillus hamazuiensis TaxID=2936508 RepID=UPI00200BA7E0|nr:nitrite reductase large subunit NirB [Paenibacillus hamazuiensis]